MSRDSRIRPTRKHLRTAIAAVAWATLAGCSSSGGTNPPAAADPPPAPAVEDPRFQAAADYSAARGGHALLVMEGEAVVFAAGQNGHDVAAPHPLHGASESFWGPLAAAADSDRLLDLDEPVTATLPAFGVDHRHSEIRLRHLLTFTSGLGAGVGIFQQGGGSPLERALALPVVSEPGERFQYGPSHLFVFGLVLREKLAARGADPVVYLQERLLEPLGVRVDTWKTNESGEPDLASGASMRAAEWAKFGRLLGQGGAWDGGQIVPEEALEDCFTGSDVYPGFGLTLWLNRAETRSDARAGRYGSSMTQLFYPNGLRDLLVAAGSGNQRLYVIPSLDLVVVRFGGLDRSWRDQSFLELLVDGATAPAGEDSEAAGLNPEGL